MKKFSAFNKRFFLYIPLAAVLVGAFAVRAYNLNYNVPFNDEAVYVVVGKLGMFQWDWWSYNARSWMAGLPYAYPALTAVAYVTGGIIGSRLFSVLFSMLLLEELYRLTLRVLPGEEGNTYIASVIALAVAGFAATGLYISRLATYDMPSFFFLLLGINYIFDAAKEHDGKGYFLAALSLLIAFATKIIVGVFIPLLIVFSFLEIRDNPRKKRLWTRYLIIPLGIGFAIYLFLNIQGFATYASSQVYRENESLAHIAAGVWENAGLVLIAAVPAACVVLVLEKKRKRLLLLLLFASVIPMLHLIAHRFSTLDKHLYLSVVFLAPVIGYAASRLISHTRPLVLNAAACACIAGVIGAYAYAGAGRMQNLESRWKDSQAMHYALSDRVRPDSRVLTEEGAGTILSLYDKIPPTQITTFDWFEYIGLTGDAAYIQAIRDGYFDFVELDGQSEVQQLLTAKVEDYLSTRYTLIYSQPPFQIYEFN